MVVSRILLILEINSRRLNSRRATALYSSVFSMPPRKLFWRQGFVHTPAYGIGKVAKTISIQAKGHKFVQSHD